MYHHDKNQEYPPIIQSCSVALRVEIILFLLRGVLKRRRHYVRHVRDMGNGVRLTYHALTSDTASTSIVHMRLIIGLMAGDSERHAMHAPALHAPPSRPTSRKSSIQEEERLPVPNLR